MKSHIFSSHLVHPLSFLPFVFYIFSYSSLSLSLFLFLPVGRVFYPYTNAGGARAMGNKERFAEERGDLRGDAREREGEERVMGWREK